MPEARHTRILDITDVWDGLETAPGEGVVVAVIDTGVDYNHIDLKANMWVNSGEVPGNGIDDDGNHDRYIIIQF